MRAISECQPWARPVADLLCAAVAPLDASPAVTFNLVASLDYFARPFRGYVATVRVENTLPTLDADAADARAAHLTAERVGGA